MIVGYVQRQGKGKTLAMVAAAYQLYWALRHQGYHIVGNVNLPYLPASAVTVLGVEELRAWVSGMVEQERGKTILLLDEIDRLFPSRFWADRKQSESLIGLWLDKKLRNYVLYTAHKGVMIDKVIRAATNIMVIPEYEKAGSEGAGVGEIEGYEPVLCESGLVGFIPGYAPVVSDYGRSVDEYGESGKDSLTLTVVNDEEEWKSVQVMEHASRFWFPKRRYDRWEFVR